MIVFQKSEFNFFFLFTNIYSSIPVHSFFAPHALVLLLRYILFSRHTAFFLPFYHIDFSL